MRTLSLAVFALSTTLVGCARDSANFDNATPTQEALAMELTGDAQAEGLATTSTPDGIGAAQSALSGQVPEYLEHARAGLRAINGALHHVLAPVEAAVAASIGKEPVGGVKEYGPKDQGQATWRLFVKRVSADVYGWRVDGKPLGADDSAYVAVMGGVFTPGAQPHHGKGVFGLDLDKVAQVDADFHGNGQALVGFAHVGGYKVLAYGLKGFSPDVASFDPVDAVFAGWKAPTGVARVRLAAWANIADSPTAAKELTLLRARWLPGVGGRADARVSKGDVPAGRAWYVNSCWDRDLSDVDGFLLVRDCSASTLLPTDCTVVRTAGLPSNCAPDLLDEEQPSADPNDPSAEPGAPDSPSLPATMPSGN